jgi:hypothetical protein
MNNALEITLLNAVIQALRDQGLAVKVQKQPKAADRRQADAWVRIAKDRTRLDYAVEIRRRVTPATLGAVIAQLKHEARKDAREPLLVTDYVTPPVAAALRVQGQQFADVAGNAYLEGPGFLVHIVGRRPAEKQPAPRANRAFATAGLKVQFALICVPDLAAAPHRTIAAAAGVALGAVPKVLADLRQAGLLLATDKTRRLNATKRLLDEWALAYARQLRPKTLLGTYVAAGFETWTRWQLGPQESRWGGEPAAALLVGYLRPGVLTVYAEKLPPRLAVEQRLVRARPLDQHNLLEVRKPFWGQALPLEREPQTGPPALVYADLLATGDARCIETAQMIHERYLARLFAAA